MEAPSLKNLFSNHYRRDVQDNGGNDSATAYTLAFVCLFLFFLGGGDPWRIVLFIRPTNRPDRDDNTPPARRAEG